MITILHKGGMVLKILHTSDIHLGFYLNGMSYYKWQDELVGTLCTLVNENNIDMVIISGDIFDRSITNEDAVSVYDRLVTQLSDCVKDVVIIAGNHDSSVRLSVLEGVLKDSGVHISGKLGKNVKMLSPSEDVRVYLLPYFTTDDVRYLYDDTSKQVKTYNEAMEIVVNDIVNGDGFDKTKTNILVTHCFVTSSTVSESDKTALMLGNAQEVDSSIFNAFDYVAAGHLHKAQHIKPNVYYSGSPLHYSFGESVSDKTINIYDTDTKDVQKVKIDTTLKIRQIKGELLDVLSLDGDKDDYVKIILTDSYITPQVYDKVKEAYKNTLMLEGKTFEYDNGENHLTLSSANINELSPREVVDAFLKDFTDIELDDELMSLISEEV